MARMRINYPDLDGQKVTAVPGVGMGGDTVTVPAWGDIGTALTLQAFGGRIATFDNQLVSVEGAEILPRTDSKTNLDLRNVKTATTLTGVAASGVPVTIDVAQMVSRDGMASADYYMLETDAVGDLRVEPGRVSPTIFVTASALAYDETKIATEVGGGLTAADITGAWLVANAGLGYGATSAKAVTQAVSKKWTAALLRTKKVVPSPHIIFECGYVYSYGFGTIHGESPLHPRVIKKWGTGVDPKGISFGGIKLFFPSNMVAIGFHVDLAARNLRNFITADAKFDGTGLKDAIAHSGENSGYLTVYRPMWHHCSFPNPGPDKFWDDSGNRCSGMYVTRTKGLLVLDGIFWHNGWEDGFAQDRSTNFGLTPSSLSHNLYLAEFNLDVTIRGTLSIQGASTGWQSRVAGWLLECLSVDDNIASSHSGARYWSKVGNRGNWGFIHRQVATSAGYKQYQRTRAGALARAHDNDSPMQAVIDCLAIHKADPDNASEIAAKPGDDVDYHSSLLSDASFFNGVSYKWRNAFNRNVDGLSTAALDATTIQRFIGSKLGQSRATIQELGEYCLTLDPQEYRAFITGAVEYFLAPMASKLHTPLASPYMPRAVAGHHVFQAESYTDGSLWYSAPNWLSREIPGQHPNDTVDINGNTVKHGIDTTAVQSIEFNGGTVEASSGVLRVGTHVDAARVRTMNCGQYYAPAGGDGDYEVRDGSRLAFIGAATVGIQASGKGSELCLSRDITIPAGKALRVTGDLGWAGWDHVGGAAVLDIEGALEFEVTPVLKLTASDASPWALDILRDFISSTGDFSGIVDGVINTDAGSGSVRIRDASGTPVVGEAHPSDVLPGNSSFPRTILAVETAEIGKLERFKSGRLDTYNAATMVWTQNQPTVTATVNLQAGSSVAIVGRQYLSPGLYDLGGGAGTGVTYANPGNIILPAGVTLTDGKLTVLIS